MKKICIICLAAAFMLTGCKSDQAPVTAGSANQQTNGVDREAPVTSSDTVSGEAESSKQSLQEEPAAGSQVSEAFREEFNKIKIDGKEISFPCSYSELKDFGFEVLYSDADVAILGAPLPASAIYNGDYESVYGIEYSYIGSGSNRKIEECDGVTFQWALSAKSSMDMEFYGGINGGSSREEVEALLTRSNGNPDEYSLYLDEEKHSGLEVVFHEDTIQMIRICNYADYMK